MSGSRSVRRGPGRYVVVDEAGIGYHPHRCTKMFEDAVKRAGVPRIRLHDTRHTMATLALEAGVHPKVVQEQLGHSAIPVTLDTDSPVPHAVRRDGAAKIAGLCDRVAVGAGGDWRRRIDPVVRDVIEIHGDAHDPHSGRPAVMRVYFLGPSGFGNASMRSTLARHNPNGCRFVARA